MFHWMITQPHDFSFHASKNKNIADTRSREMEATLAPLNLECSWKNMQLLSQFL